MTLGKALVTLALTLGSVGCLSSTNDYVDEHYHGYSIVRGTLSSVDGLKSSNWQHLSDGLAVEVAPPGCTITIHQGDGDERTLTRTFLLSPGDRLVWGRKLDMVLYALKEKTPGVAEPPTQPQAPPVAQPQPAQPQPAPVQPAPAQPAQPQPR